MKARAEMTRGISTTELPDVRHDPEQACRRLAAAYREQGPLIGIYTSATFYRHRYTSFVWRHAITGECGLIALVAIEETEKMAGVLLREIKRLRAGRKAAAA